MGFTQVVQLMSVHLVAPVSLILFYLCNNTLRARSRCSRGGWSLLTIVMLLVFILTGVTEAFAARPDRTSPTISISSPSSGTTYTTTTPVTITATASDNVGVTKVEFYRGGILQGTDTSAPYTYAWSFSSANNGSHSWTAKAYDSRSNVGTSNTVSVTVSIDSTPPTVSISTPTSGSMYTSTQTVNIAASAADNMGVSRVEFYRNGALQSTDTTAPYGHAWGITNANNGSHSWTAKSYDAATNVGTSVPVSVTVSIATADTTPPTVSISSPTTGATYTTAQTVTITASATDTGGLSKVEFYRTLGTTTPALQCTVTFAGALSAAPTCAWPISSATNGTYSWTAKAYDTANNINTSPAISATVNISTTTTTIPNAPGTLVGTPVSSNQINLTWVDNSSNESGFKVERSTGTSGWVQLVVLNVNTTSYTDTGLSNSTTYSYRVKSYNSAGDSGYSNTANATTQSTVTAPTAPSSLTTAAASSSQINLNWADNSNNETGFKIERATASAGPWTQIGTTGAGVASYSSTGLSASTTYYYRVRAYNTVGDSAYSNTTNATTQSIVTTPTAPSSLTAAAVSSSQINLSWVDMSSNETGFKIERAPATAPTSWTQIGTTGAGVTTYSDTGITPNTLCYYRARAYNTAGDSGYSNTANATTLGSTTSAGLRWSDGFGGSGSDYGTAVATDASNNIIVAGYFQGTVDFGGGPLTSAGGNDIFVAKYSATGLHLWSKRFGSTAGDYAQAVAVDSGGNVVVAGYFSGSADFGSGLLASAGGTDIFVARYSSTGTHLWSKRLGSATDDAGYSVAVGSDGSVILSGFFTGTVDFGGGALASVYGGMDVFLAKYSATGGHVWSRSFWGPSTEVGYGVAIEGSGNITITGSFSGKIDLGGGQMTTAGFRDVFMAKYSSAGTYLWSQRFGGTDDDVSYGIAMDGSGNVAVTGYFVGTVNFGGGPLTSAGSSDIFVAKYSSTGTHVWSKRFGALGDEAGYDVAVDSSGSVIITGLFKNTVDFGGGSLTSAGVGIPDIFVAKYSATGSYVWSKRFGSTSNDTGYGIAVDTSATVLVTGYFQGTVDFGDGPLTSAGSSDVFFLSLAP